MQQNTKVALRQIAQVKPAVFEASQEQRKVLVSRLDSLKRSAIFFLDEYRKHDRAASLMHILAEIAETENRVAVVPKAYSIGQLCKKNPEKLDDNIVLILNDLRLFFQVDNMISTDGLYSLCGIITSEYKNLTLEEIAMCMNNAKLGNYGKLYNRLDGAIILSWLKQYVTEKQLRIDDRNYMAEANNKIGVGEGRSTFKGDNATLINQAYAVVAIEKANKKKNNRKLKRH